MPDHVKLVALDNVNNKMTVTTGDSTNPTSTQTQALYAKDAFIRST